MNDRTYDQLCRDLARHFSGRVFAAHVDMLREFLSDGKGVPAT